MTIPWVCQVILRDLDSLKDELLAYQDEADIWRLAPGIKNSAGTLTLHLAGNLQHFVGAQLGRTGYVRDRENEFVRRDVPREELLQEIAAAKAAVVTGLDRLKEADLAQPYPLALGEACPTTGSFLVHLATHLAYHLGQVDYHRRLVTGDATVVGAVAIPRQ